MTKLIKAFGIDLNTHQVQKLIMSMNYSSDATLGRDQPRDLEMI
jgi:hypothetical protein